MIRTLCALLALSFSVAPVVLAQEKAPPPKKVEPAPLLKKSEPTTLSDILKELVRGIKLLNERMELNDKLFDLQEKIIQELEEKLKKQDETITSLVERFKKQDERLRALEKQQKKE